MNDRNILLSIIIPCYNEEKNLSILLEKFDAVIKSNEIELILVENGSNDNSNFIMRNLLQKYFFVKMAKVEVNRGYGYGIKEGLKIAQGKFIGYTHADLQTDPNDVIKAFEIIKLNNFNENIFIKGNRKKRPIFDQLFTNGMSLFESIYLRKKLIDINAQPTFFSYEFYTSLKNIPNDFSIDLYLLFIAQKRKLNLIRFDVFFPPRIHGVSSWNTGIKSKWKFIKRTLTYSFLLKKILHGNNIS